jgi:hypothetical protein
VIGTSSSTTATGQQGHTNSLMIFRRSVTDSAATNFSNSTNLVSMFSASMTFSVRASVTSQSISMSLGWQTDSTGGSSSVTSSTNAAAFQVAQFSGQRFLSVAWASKLSAGEYWIAQGNSSSTAGYASASSLLRWSQLVMTNATNGTWGNAFGANANGSVLPNIGVGVYSVTSGAFPTSVAMSVLSNESVHRRYYQFEA